MGKRRSFVLFVLIPLLVFSWIVIATIWLEPGGRSLEYPIIGYLLGTMFGQATMASAWVAFGPLPLLMRGVLSLGWITCMFVAFMLNFAVNEGPGEPEIALTMGGCMLGQWILVQAPLWGLTIGYGLRVRHRTEAIPVGAAPLQFGIRQLMILTAIVAVFLAIGRVAISQLLQTQISRGSSEVLIFVFLAVAGVVMTLPLLLAALLPRYAIPAALLVVCLIFIGTWAELPLLSLTFAPGNGPDLFHLLWINAFQSLWVVLVVGILRLCGYSLVVPQMGVNPFAQE